MWIWHLGSQGLIDHDSYGKSSGRNHLGDKIHDFEREEEVEEEEEQEEQKSILNCSSSSSCDHDCN